MNPTYYAELRALRNTLNARHPDGSFLAVSIANPLKGSTAGNVCEVDLTIGARCLLAETHREASPEEARLYRDAQELTRARATTDPLEAARKQFGLLVKKGEQRP
jgi:hypothetical protein